MHLAASVGVRRVVERPVDTIATDGDVVHANGSGGTATVSTFATIGLGGPISGVVAFGYELLLPPYADTTASG